MEPPIVIRPGMTRQEWEEADHRLHLLLLRQQAEVAEVEQWITQLAALNREVAD